MQIHLICEYDEETDALEGALNAEEQNSSIYASCCTFRISDLKRPGSETEKLLKALKSEKGNIRVAAIMALGERKRKSCSRPHTRDSDSGLSSGKAVQPLHLEKLGMKGQ